MKKLLLLLPWILCQTMWAQLDEPFRQINTDFLSTNIFKNQSPSILNWSLRNGEGTRATTPGQGKQLILELQEACIGDSSRFCLRNFRSEMEQKITHHQAVPLCIVDILYNELKPWVIDSGMVDTIGGQWLYVDELSRNPMQKSDLFSVFWYTDPFPKEVNSIILDEAFYFSNRALPDYMLIDLGDDMGYRPFQWGETIELPETHEELEVKIIFHRQEESYKAVAVSAAGSCNAGIDPDLPPWNANEGDFPWMIDAEYEGKVVKANAYVKYSYDSPGQLDKPFVFVEGIDFNRTEHYPTRNGDFGWCQFAGGNDPQYSFLYNMPNLIEQLRQNGYDIILLDFYDGADFVESNAELLKELIRLINLYKVGEEPNIIAGASMGGQVSRYALAAMEAEGEPHCTRLWISLDSPHTGAHVPISIQYLLAYLANPIHPTYALAQSKLIETLLRPAARQFLLQQLQFLPDLSNSYYANISDLGYPKYLRSLSIANGNARGLGQQLQPGEFIDHNVGFLGSPIVWLRAFTAPGPTNNGYEHLLFSGRLPTSNLVLPNFLGGGCIPTSYYTEQRSTIGPIFEGLEFCPGGYRTSIQELVNELNEVISDGECDADPVSNFQALHSFIPTASALGLPMSVAFEDIDQWLTSNDSLMPFDQWKFAEGENEQHSEISDESLEFVMLEVLSGENPLGHILDHNEPNNGLFNAAREEFSYLRGLNIQNGGELHLNGDQPIYFAENPNEFSNNGSHMRFFLGSCSSGMTVSLDGELHIGSESGSRTAELNLIAGSELVIESNGKVIIHSGSSLRVRDLATLRMIKGKILIEPGARLEILEGAEAQLNDQVYWGLLGTDAQVDLRNDFHFFEGAKLKVYFLNSGSRLEINAQSEWHGDGNNRVEFRGAAESLGELVISEGSWLSMDVGFERFRCQYMRAELPSGISISTDALTILRSSEFYGTEEPGSEFEIFRNASISNCYFEEVELRIDQMDLVDRYSTSIANCDFSGDDAFVRCLSGGMNVSNCNFLDNARLRSAFLDYDGNIRDCVFQGDGPQIPFSIFALEDIAYADDSPVKVTVKGSSFENYRGAAISKAQGELELNCGNFLSNHTGVLIIDGVKLWMNDRTSNGGNYFEDNRIHIETQGGDHIYLKNGRNSFQNAVEHCVYGYLDEYCACSSDFTLDGTGNDWIPGDFVYSPDPTTIELWFEADCEYQPWQERCPISIIDQAPLSFKCSSGGIPIATFKSAGGDLRGGALVYPNPSNTKITVESVQMREIDLLDSRGQLINKWNVSSNSKTLDLSHISAGHYFLRIITESNTHFKKLIID